MHSLSSGCTTVSSGPGRERSGEEEIGDDWCLIEGVHCLILVVSTTCVGAWGFSSGNGGEVEGGVNSPNGSGETLMGTEMGDVGCAGVMGQ